MACSQCVLGLGHVDEDADAEEGSRVHHTGHLSHLPFWGQRSKRGPSYERSLF